jgi:hypothetical protein
MLCGFESGFITLRAEHRLKMHGHRESRRIFGPKRKEVTGGWRNMCNDELNYVTHRQHSPPSSSEVKNAWSCTSTPQYVYIVWCLI